MSVISYVFKSPWILTAVFCVSIVGRALWYYFFQFRPHITAASNEMQKLLRSLDECSSHSDFTYRIGTVANEAAALPSLRHAWEEFQEILIMPPSCESTEGGLASDVISDEDLDVSQSTSIAAPIKNTRDPREYFYPESLLHGKINWRLLGSIPGYLTAFGILGTFVGLAISLWLHGQEIQAQNMSELGQLVTGAGIAFATSAVGLVSSVVFSVAEKHEYRSLVDTCDSFCNRLDQLLVRITPDQILDEVLESSRQQSLHLERFNNEFAINMAENMQSVLAKSVGEPIHGLVRKIENFHTESHGAAVDALERMVTEFHKQVSEGLRDEIGTVEEMLVSLKDSIVQTIEMLDGATERMAQRFEESSRSITESLEGHSRQMIDISARAVREAVVEISQASEQSAAHLVQTSEKLTVLIDSFSGTAEDLQSSATLLEEALGAYADWVESSSAASRSLMESTQRLVAQIEEVNRASQALGVAAEDIGSIRGSIELSAKALDRAAGELGNLWSEEGKRLTKLSDDVTGVLDNLHSGSKDYGTTLLGFVRDIDAQFAESLNTLASYVKGLEDSVESIEQATLALTEALSKSGESSTTDGNTQ